MAKSYYEARTPRWQRITIWIIAIAMAGGTLLGFVFMALAARNPELASSGITAKKTEEAQAELEKKETERQKKIDAQNAELTKKYLAELNSYQSQVQAFEPTGLGDVKTEDLKIGDGAEITDDNTNYSMYYIGWKPTGEIFDSSIDGETLKSPLPGSGSYITGWNEGVIGMKIGGVRLITIPADKAYGADGSGCDEDGENCVIPPDTPLKFIVMAIATPDDIPYPKGTLAVCEKAFASYATQYGIPAVELCQLYGYDNEEK
ncbi:FKBP-type peptidyl-prolyl cis-trans isomerase [Candidatus Saccharibacteria bacterium]|nr:FKBP-type peptidyl-prolyl cis-trans isomerase [Candidatus Saccharibacteria bacterium]